MQQTPDPRLKLYTTAGILGGFMVNREVVKTAQARDLEAKGAETWLRTLAPRTFFSPFSAEHKEFWAHYWLLLEKKLRGEVVAAKDRNLLFLLNRGGGKSSNMEMAAIAEGCVTGGGFALYLSDTSMLAEDHLFSVKDILENGQIEQFYPAMAKPLIQKESGKTAKYNADTITTEGNWAMQARGISGSVRGGRFGAQRFSLVICDDIDALNDSLVVTEKKLRILSRTVLPAMSKSGVFLLGQNLIQKNSVATQIYERKTDILSERTIVTGEPVKAFKNIELTSRADADGTPRWHIARATPTWEYFDLEDARNFLSRSGREAFLAEYQHEFDERKGKVISNYNEDAQVITWSQFESIFGRRYIPPDWTAEMAGDIGYSEGNHPHYSAWSFMATAAQNTPLPGKLFVYRSLTFKATSIDDQAIAIWNAILPNDDHPYPEYYADFKRFPMLRHLDFPREWSRSAEIGTILRRFQISHEKTGEMLTMRQKYGLPIQKAEFYKATDGVAQWNTVSLSDRTVQNPFKEDLQDEDGLWLIGCPTLFYVIDDDQLSNPRNDRGMKLLREQVANWEYVTVRITENGLSEEKPSKVGDDVADSIKMLMSRFGQHAKPLTERERRESNLPAHLQQSALNSIPDGEDRERANVSRAMEFGKMDEQKKKVNNTVSKYRPQVPKMKIR